MNVNSAAEGPARSRRPGDTKNKLYTTAVIAILFASATSLPAEAQRSVDRSTPLLHDVLTANADQDPEPANAAVFMKIEGVDGESQSAAPGVEPDEIDVLNTARDEGLEPDEIDASNTARSETRRSMRRPNRSKMVQDRRARQRQTTRSADEGLSVDADGDGHAVSPSVLILPAVQGVSDTSADQADEGIVPHISTLDGLEPSHPEANQASAECSCVINSDSGSSSASAGEPLPTEEVTLGYTEVEWTNAREEAREAPNRRKQARPTRRGASDVDNDSDGTASSDSFQLSGGTLSRSAAAAETDDNETGIVPHYRRWDGDIYPAATTSTEDVEGDGDLEIEADSELTIVRTAAEASEADTPAPTRVRRGMQELKN
ncbi:MAG: hypothetical protein QUV02_14015 [Maricaulis sp.]|jgi:hypothetical protein|uniref:hypothetical protein n=1 Tax=Maricaulis sp. TaxID=1486257 RepID=UPI00262D03AA|nr:hypothetical protein [Maricaulis sp.]MDM7985553.1 hypothetical protein [Maricaulis sp.]